MTDDLIIYTPWPLDVVNTAISEFNYQMHDGAGIEELSAGLHGLDFLTRRSALDDDTTARLSGATIEAEMRIQLIGTKEAGDRTTAENFERAERAMQVLQLQVRSIQRLIERPRFDEDELQEYIHSRISVRKATEIL